MAPRKVNSLEPPYPSVFLGELAVVPLFLQLGCLILDSAYSLLYNACLVRIVAVLFSLWATVSMSNL